MKTNRKLLTIIGIAGCLLLAGIVYAGTYNPNCHGTLHTTWDCYRAPGSSANPSSPLVQVTEAGYGQNFCVKNLNNSDMLIPSNTANELSFFKSRAQHVNITEGACGAPNSCGTDGDFFAEYEQKRGVGPANYNDRLLAENTVTSNVMNQVNATNLSTKNSIRDFIQAHFLVGQTSPYSYSQYDHAYWGTGLTGDSARSGNFTTSDGAQLHWETEIYGPGGGANTSVAGFLADFDLTLANPTCDSGGVGANWYLHSGGSASVTSCVVNGCGFGDSNTGPITQVIDAHPGWDVTTKSNAKALAQYLLSHAGFPGACDAEYDNNCPSPGDGEKSGVYTVSNGAVSPNSAGPGQKFAWETTRWNLTEGSCSPNPGDPTHCTPGVQTNAGIYISDPGGSGSGSNSPAPTATLLTNGRVTSSSNPVTVNVGDIIRFQWSSTNGTSYYSTYYDTRSGVTAPWGPDTASGDSSGPIDQSQAGAHYTLIYYVSGPGGSTSATAYVNVTGTYGGSAGSEGTLDDTSGASGASGASTVD